MAGSRNMVVNSGAVATALFVIVTNASATNSAGPTTNYAAFCSQSKSTPFFRTRRNGSLVTTSFAVPNLCHLARERRHLSSLLSSIDGDSDNNDVSSTPSRRGRPPGGKDVDGNEWQALVLALQMYKAAYGDLKVPSRFVVPSILPWPEPAWGLKLGQRVASIRSTGKYIQDDDGRRQTLEDMGFLWRLRAPSREAKMDGITFDQVFEALQTYKEEIQPEGKINVPSNFVVPNADPWPESTRGLPLGKKIPAIRSKTYLKANPGAADRLAKLGFEFDGKAAANDQRYQKVYDALERYKEFNGDLLVPQPFVVPSGDDDWPEETWGLRLGARVNAIRSQGTFVKTNPDRKQELDELGFEWELPAEGKKRGRKKKVENEALQGPAPPGMLEGGLSGASGSSGANEPYGDALFPFPDQKANKPLVWGFEDDDEEDEQDIVDEIPIERDLNSTLEEMLEVAKSVGIVRFVDEGNRILKGKREKDCAWYIDDFGEDFVFEDVVESLTVFKEINGNFDGLTDEDFVVPDPADSLFGESSTAAFDAESSAAAAAAIAAAERGEGGDSEAMIAAEIERLEKDIQSSLSTEDEGDEDGEVEEQAETDSSVAWPEHLAGMRLGNIVRRIRDGSLEVKHLRERRRKLDAIGFDWGDPKRFLDVPFEKAMCAMLAYYQVRGDMMVPADFVIPNEIPWPQALAGYRLGNTVVRIRELQNFFEAYHTDKVALLKMVDFFWDPDYAVPLDPFAWDETFEDDLLTAVGSPFYWLGEEENLRPGLNEDIIADGPTDNPNVNAKWHNYEQVRYFWEGDQNATEVIQFFDDKFGAHLPAATLWSQGFPKLARDQEVRYASGKLGDIVRERDEVETQEDNLLRPIMRSMATIHELKNEYEVLSKQLEAGNINQEIFDAEKALMEWKVEDTIYRLRGVTKDFEGGARGEGERVREKRQAYAVKEAAYEKEVEYNIQNFKSVLLERFPDYEFDEDEEEGSEDIEEEGELEVEGEGELEVEEEGELEVEEEVFDDEEEEMEGDVEEYEDYDSEDSEEFEEDYDDEE